MAIQRYIPPGLRGAMATDTDQVSAHPEPSQGDGETDYTTLRQLSDLRLSEEQRQTLHTLSEIIHHYGGLEGHATLHDSAQTPGQLAYIVLFRNANPRWYPDRIIFAHTSINILSGYQDFQKSLSNEEQCAEKEGHQACDHSTSPSHTLEVADDIIKPTSEQNAELVVTEPVTGQPPETGGLANATPAESDIIPVFSEVAARKDNGRKFAFHGYFRLMRVQFLKPHSPEVARLLQQKWEPANNNPNRPPHNPRKRGKVAWEKSMGEEWAVIKMGKVHDEELEGVEDPVIEVMQSPEQEERRQRKEMAYKKRSDVFADVEGA